MTTKLAKQVWVIGSRLLARKTLADSDARHALMAMIFGLPS